MVYAVTTSTQCKATRAHVQMATRAKIVKLVKMIIKFALKYSLSESLTYKLFFLNQKALPCILSQPCENNGNCTNDMVGGYTCSCENGYTGQTCQNGILLFFTTQKFKI